MTRVQEQNEPLKQTTFQQRGGQRSQTRCCSQNKEEAVPAAAESPRQGNDSCVRSHVEGWKFNAVVKISSASITKAPTLKTLRKLLFTFSTNRKWWVKTSNYRSHSYCETPPSATSDKRVFNNWWRADDWSDVWQLQKANKFLWIPRRRVNVGK